MSGGGGGMKREMLLALRRVFITSGAQRTLIAKRLGRPKQSDQEEILGLISPRFGMSGSSRSGGWGGCKEMEIFGTGFSCTAQSSRYWISLSILISGKFFFLPEVRFNESSTST